MIAGELDMSVGSMAALASVCVVKLVGFGVGVAPALAIVVAGAAVFGAAQGLAITALNVNSLVFTVGTLIGLRGLALIAANESTPTLPLDMLSISDAVSSRYWIFSPLSAAMLIAFALAGLFASRTIWGREIYAIGGGRAEFARSRRPATPADRPRLRRGLRFCGVCGRTDIDLLRQREPPRFRGRAVGGGRRVPHRGRRARGRKGRLPRNSDRGVHDFDS